MASKHFDNDGHGDGDDKENQPNRKVLLPMDEPPSPSDYVVDVPKELYNAHSKFRYSTKEFLGSGTFSKCFKVRLCEVLGVKLIRIDQNFACKVLPKEAYTQFPDLSQAHKSEINIIRGFSHHDNVLGLFEHFEDAKHIYIMLPFCSRGSLFDVWERSNWQMADSTVRMYLRHILSGLNFIHRHRIIHVDLKFENVFINDQGLARIGDFGLSVRFDGHRANADGEMRCPNRGTIIYLAYESVTRGVVSYKTDVWAFAVLAYILKVKQAPFWSAAEERILDEIRDIHYIRPSGIRNDFIRLFEAVFVRDVTARPNVQQCMALLNLPH